MEQKSIYSLTVDLILQQSLFFYLAPAQFSTTTALSFMYFLLSISWFKSSQYLIQKNHKGKEAKNKLAKLQATLVRNYDSPTDSLTGVKCRATSVAKKFDKWA